MTNFVEERTKTPTESLECSVRFVFGFGFDVEKNRPKPTEFSTKNRQAERAILQFRFTTPSAVHTTTAVHSEVKRKQHSSTSSSSVQFSTAQGCVYTSLCSPRISLNSDSRRDGFGVFDERYFQAGSIFNSTFRPHFCTPRKQKRRSQYCLDRVSHIRRHIACNEQQNSVTHPVLMSRAHALSV